MPRYEQGLPDGRQVAAYLDGLYRSATRSGGPLFPPAPSFVEQPQPAFDEVLRKRINFHIQSFVATIDQNIVERIGIRNAASRVRESFDAWRPERVDSLRSRNAPQDELQAVESLTLRDIGAYANEQLTRFSGEAAQLPNGTHDQRLARMRSDYWRRMGELLGPRRRSGLINMASVYFLQKPLQNWMHVHN